MVRELTTMPSISGVTITWHPSRDLMRERRKYKAQGGTGELGVELAFALKPASAQDLYVDTLE